MATDLLAKIIFISIYTLYTLTSVSTFSIIFLVYICFCTDKENSLSNQSFFGSASPSQPIKCNDKTNHDLVTGVFPRFKCKQVACFYFEFSLVNDVNLRSDSWKLFRNTSIFFKSLLRFSRLNFTALKLNGTHIGNLAMSRNWTTFLTILGELETLIWHISSFNSSQQRSQDREYFFRHSLDSEQYWIELCSFSKAKGRHLWWFFSSRSHASIVIDTTTKISQDALMWTYFLDKPLKKSTFNLCAPN